eukprot:2297485-Ditylum_brightwellii.AAC.1
MISQALLSYTNTPTRIHSLPSSFDKDEEDDEENGRNSLPASFCYKERQVPLPPMSPAMKEEEEKE